MDWSFYVLIYAILAAVTLVIMRIDSERQQPIGPPGDSAGLDFVLSIIWPLTWFIIVVATVYQAIHKHRHRVYKDNN